MQYDHHAAIDLLKTLTDRPDLGPQPLLLELLESDAGDLVSAEDLYRRALKIDANLPDAQNNLAYIVLQQKGDLNEAKDFVTRAHRWLRSPPITTLARINEKLDNRDQTQAEFVGTTTGLRLARHPGLCRSLNATGKRDRANGVTLHRLHNSTARFPPSESTHARELQDLREAALQLQPRR